MLRLLRAMLWYRLMAKRTPQKKPHERLWSSLGRLLILCGETFHCSRRDVVHGSPMQGCIVGNIGRLAVELCRSCAMLSIQTVVERRSMLMQSLDVFCERPCSYTRVRGHQENLHVPIISREIPQCSRDCCITRPSRDMPDASARKGIRSQSLRTDALRCRRCGYCGHIAAMVRPVERQYRPSSIA